MAKNHIDGDDYFDDSCTSPPRRVNEALVLRDLLEKGEVEFSLDANENEESEELKVEDAYKFEEYEQLINLDCIGVDNTDKMPFEILEDKMTPITSDRGVMKLIKVKGTGLKVPENAFVYIHYSCFLEFEEVPFDSSYLRSSKPSKFQVGTGKLFPGLDIGIMSMNEGEKAYLLVKPKYAFKEMGVPPRIPMNATILVDIHLIKTVDCGAIIENEETVSGTEKRTFTSISKKAKSYMELGRDCFSHNSYGQAADSYRKAVFLLSGCELADDEEEALFIRLIMKAYTNLMICYNGLHQYRRVCSFARDAVSVNPTVARTNAKLQYNWGKALKFLGEFKSASEHLKFAKAVEPNNLEVDKLLKEIEEQRKVQQIEDKIRFSRALGLQITPNEKKEKVEEDSTFYEKIKEELKKFALSKNSRFDLPPGMVPTEVDVVRKICTELGLTFREYKIGVDLKMCILK